MGKFKSHELVSGVSQSKPMASSLEDLLQEEGFRGRRSVSGQRRSFHSDSSSMHKYPSQVRSNADSPSGLRVRTGRSRSDVAWHARRDGLSKSDDARDRLGDDFVKRGKSIVESRFRNSNGHERRHVDCVRTVRMSNVDSPQEYERNEIVEEGDEEENSIFKDIYSTEKCYLGRKSGHSGEVVEKERAVKDLEVYKTRDASSSRVSSVDSYQKSMTQPEDEFRRSKKGSQDGKVQIQNHIYFPPLVSHPALDEVAVQAMVSILGGYIKHFLKDDEFRTTLHHNCFSSFNFIGLEDQTAESKIIASLVQAIETVEKVAEKPSSAKELKKASLQLSLITGLNSNHFKDGFTSGVPNSVLSACAHLYLSNVYMLQKKERVSARHLLQVFCDSPFQARTKLLPELWDSVFYPHLSHLKVWYSQEVEFLSDAPNKGRKLKLVEKVYNEILDSGTYQLAVYYKDWLTEGVEAPPFPSIKIPTTSVAAIQQGGPLALSSDAVSQTAQFSPQPKVSKQLYDDVFGRSSRTGAEVEHDADSLNSSNYKRSQGGSPADIKHDVTDSFDSVKYSYQEEILPKSEQKDAFFHEVGMLLTVDEEQRFPGRAELAGKDIQGSGDSFYTSNILETPSEHADTKHEMLLLSSVNKLQFQSTAKSAGLPRNVKDHVDAALYSLSYPDVEQCCSSQQVVPFAQVLHGDHKFRDKASLSSSIPQEFLCPLTGELFENPVTLETGQTFEQAAIKEWFDQGKRTCPATGKSLEYLSVPAINSVLDRVINRWKSEHSRNLLEFAPHSHKPGAPHWMMNIDEIAIFILENLVTSLCGEDRAHHIKHLICLGGLDFCIHKLKSGKSEVKACAAALLFFCIEVDIGCRNQIARNINLQCLLEPLGSKQAKSRENAVLLLYELICLSRQKDILQLISSLLNEEIGKALNSLLVYLQSAPPDQVPLVAAVLLRLDLLVELHGSIYRDEAVDALSVALSNSLNNEVVRERCCRTLLILGGQFSCSGKVLTESWILKKAGVNNHLKKKSPGSAEDDLVGATATPDEEEDDVGEENDFEEWLRNLSAALLGCGHRSFFDAISKCLGSQHSDLVEACLVTVAWMSCVLSSLPDAEYQLAAFATLISHLKKNLENGKTVKLKALASMSLLNFSKISECRVLLKTIAEEMAAPLMDLASITWTAKKLYHIISGEDI